MRKQNRILLFLVVFLMAMTGCQKTVIDTKKEEKKEGGMAKGRYVEKMLPMPDGYQGEGSMGVLEDESLLLVDVKNGVIYKSDDGGQNWKTRKQKELQRLASQETVEIQGAAVSPKGGIFISYILYQGDDYTVKCLFLDEKERKKEFELGIPLGVEDYMAFVRQAVFTQKGDLYVYCEDGGTYEINLKKKKAGKRLDIESSLEDSLFAVGEDIAVVSKEKVSVYHPESGETDTEDAVLNDHIKSEDQKNNAVILGGNSSEKIWAASADGLYAHVRKGSVMEQLAEGNLTSLSEPSKEAAELFVLEDDTILILYQSGELASYTYDADASMPDRQLTVYSLYDNDTVHQAINVFRQSQPDTYVKLEIGMSGEDGVTESDAIRNLSTEVLAGKGPDVLLLDGIPLDSYMEKGILMDLTDVTKKLEEKNQYFDNILKAYGNEKGLYALPIRFYLPLLTGNQETIEKIRDLDTLADVAEQLAEKSNTKETVLGSYSAKELLERLYPVCEPNWIKEHGVDKDAVKEFLVQAKRIYQAEQKNLDKSEIEAYEEVRKNLDNSVNQDKERYLLGLDGQLQLYRQIMKHQALTAGIYKSMTDIQTLVSIQKKERRQSFILFPGQEKNVFLTSGLVGLVAGTKEKELAVAFLEMLLGEKVQGKDLGDGFPVNRDAFADYSECLKPQNDDGGIALSIGGEDVFSMELVWPSGKELEKLEQMMETLKVPAGFWEENRDSVLEIGGNVLTDEKGVEEGVEEICQKMHLLEEE